jgi:hypothetical protein
MRGSLFTRDFLQEGIKDTEAWRTLDALALNAFETALTAIYAAFDTSAAHNEATTEDDVIFKVLAALGWIDYLPQQTASERRADVPDALLFASTEQKRLATSERKQTERYRHGIAILENKPWQTPLDREAGAREAGRGVPSNQILRYLTVAEIQSDRRIKWGILTNGRHWRLYYQLARSRSEDFLELDIPELLGIKDFTDLLSPKSTERQHWLKVLLLIFGRQSFLPSTVEGRSFLDVSLEEGKLWESRVAKNLSELVFNEIFPQLLTGLAKHDPKAPDAKGSGYLREIKEASLILLYRLLFVLYAEDRNLLPVRDKRYDNYSLRDRLRRPIADRIDASDVFADTLSDYYSQFLRLCRAIDKGEKSLGLPPYNGGLFDPDHVPILERTELPDAVFAPLLDKLSRRTEEGQRHWINYRDLTVQQLGSIYERLLEFEPFIEDGSELVVRPNIFARRGTGSYYTPEELVHLIIESTVGPLVTERLNGFERANERLAKDRRPKKERLAELAMHDPATLILELRVCDPAMGSGHFLVSLVDYLADEVLEAVAEAESLVTWSEDNPYRSPLTERIAKLRARIHQQAQNNKWVVEEGQLDDRHIVRRIILKRVIHGVDMNPMAVELAKVALWLHTFTVGAPLSFLDHHLRVGNSLFGERLRPVMDELAGRYSLLINPTVMQARNAAKGMQQIENLSDADITEVKNSATAFRGVMDDTRALNSFLDLRQAMRWLGVEKLDQGRLPLAVNALFDGSLGDPFKLIAGGLHDKDDGAQPKLSAPRKQKATKIENAELAREAARLIGRAHELVTSQRFLHWQVAFPDVWDKWDSTEPEGGFDAVIGNPPWDRIKLQEIEWFAVRRPDIALSQTAAERQKKIVALQKSGDPLAKEFEYAQGMAEAAARVARSSGDYPLLSRGDINIYSLFVERALSLISPRGLMGFLTPSGISSDLGASEFFQKIATAGRLFCLYDFENGKRGQEAFFPDVHKSFKFNVLVAGGAQRKTPNAQCAFFVHDLKELHDPSRAFTLSPSDFSSVNPNTGTAPIFRSARDAELTTAIYHRVPVLVDRRPTKPANVFPIRYATMFHMTNDSGKFRSMASLQAVGAYPVEDGLWKKGKEIFIPLYEGKMVQAFDHRAASVEVDASRLHRPGQPEAATLAESQNPDWLPTPQFLVSSADVPKATGLEWVLAFKDVTAPTNVRTMIAAAIPYTAAGNTLPLLLPLDDELTAYKRFAPLLLANLNSFALDYVARQKVQGQHLNWYIVEQLPILPESRYQRRFGTLSARDLVFRETLHLTYVSNDMKPFADDMGFEGKPFKWDEEERRHARARLDALYFILYGISRDEAAYILDTFPIVQRQDEAAFNRYVTKDLILSYIAAFEAGDTDSRIALR